ncbi:flavodoxin-like protein [Oceanicola sp. S124]|uniref:flavodoxin-like protein n=1 Tax=Oceanicola sp. S124 TaxID=1042378 RepID=UPI0002557ED2|nr:flavodoxin-like protein [Oceanicola sp. S124]
MTCRILLHSIRGRTHKVGEELAWELGAQLHEIDAENTDQTIFGRLRSGFSALVARGISIAVPDQPWDRSDLLILGAPVWNGKAARPMRQWLEGRPALPARVAFLLISDETDYPAEAVEDLSSLTGRKPVAVLHVSDTDFSGGTWKGRLEHFLDQCVVRYRNSA